jgi:septal ring factor EnvC (AmiA/AmiB activator)
LGVTALLGIARVVPLWVWALIACLAWGGYNRLDAGRQAAKRAEAEKAAAVQATAAAEQAKARERETALVEATGKAADAYRADLAKRQAAAASVRADLDRLRDAVAAAPGASASSASASAPGGTDGAAGLRVVVRECAASLSQVAEAADACNSRLMGLQEYVRATAP